MNFPAISIKQPWAYAILKLGKDCENRSWHLPSRYHLRTVLLHAGKRIDYDGYRHLVDKGFVIRQEQLALGGIVGFALFSVTSIRGESEWEEQGLFNWSIRVSGELPFYACKGSLGFFKVDYPYPLPEITC
jgi:hypothetical protein